MKMWVQTVQPEFVVAMRHGVLQLGESIESASAAREARPLDAVVRPQSIIPAQLRT
jgi:hypothetical protein